MSEHATAYKAQRLRHLLPADSKRPQMRATGPHSKPRLDLVTAACSACRKQKAKVLDLCRTPSEQTWQWPSLQCSGERPACRHCVQRHIQCHYTTKPGETESQALNRKHRDLQVRATALEELVELLRNLPYEDAQGVLQRIRAKTDIGTILSHVKAGDLLLQLTVLPETRLRYEFPYRSEMPEDYVPNNPYLDSLIYEGTSLYSRDGFPERSKHTNTSSIANLCPDGYQSLYLRPFHAAQVIDPQLSNVKISSWTTVCGDDVLMRELLGGFLRCEYHFTAIFQKDLFLEDMAEQREDFCSSLLVNIILGYSCVWISQIFYGWPI